jgi:hypothetical protein
VIFVSILNSRNHISNPTDNKASVPKSRPLILLENATTQSTGFGTKRLLAQTMHQELVSKCQKLTNNKEIEQIGIYKCLADTVANFI